METLLLGDVLEDGGHLCENNTRRRAVSSRLIALVKPKLCHDRSNTSFQFSLPTSFAPTGCLAHGGKAKVKLTSSSSGAPTLISRHRLRIGPMIMLVDSAQRIILRLPMYFSIVRRRAAWASRESESAELMTTTERAGEW